MEIDHKIGSGTGSGSWLKLDFKGYEALSIVKPAHQDIQVWSLIESWFMLAHYHSNSNSLSLYNNFKKYVMVLTYGKRGQKTCITVYGKDFNPFSTGNFFPIL